MFHFKIACPSCIFILVILCFNNAISQVGIGTTNPRGTLEVQEPTEFTEAPILVLSGYDDRTMSLLQPDITNDDDPFTFTTENAFQFRIDAKDALVIDAQGQVGINTTDALADFHLAGASSTMRLDFLNGANNLLNNGIDPAVLMINGDGDAFLKESVNDFPLDDSDDGTFFNTPIIIADPNGSMVAATAYSTTITLTRKTIVEVIFWTNVDIKSFAGNTPYDLKPRMYGGIVTHQGTNTDIAYSASSFTNALTGVINPGTIISSDYTIGGNGFITLDPGVHTIDLTIFAAGGGPILSPLSLAEGYQVTFGGNSNNRFQLIYHN